MIDGDDVFVPEGTMLGRLRTYKTYGADVRAEFANRALVGGMRQDLQIGAKYEFNDFTNKKNFFGLFPARFSMTGINPERTSLIASTTRMRCRPSFRPWFTV